MSVIEKYIRRGVFPRYHFYGFKEKLPYSREEYEYAKEVYSKYPYNSDMFIKHVSNVARVLMFPIDSVEAHPKYQLILEKVRCLKEMCKYLYPEKDDLWYISRGGNMPAKEKNLTYSVLTDVEQVTYTLYNRYTPVVASRLAYATEEGKKLPTYSDIKGVIAEIVKLVGSAPWLPYADWKTITIKEPVDSNKVYVMGKLMSEYYISQLVYKGSVNFVTEEQALRAANSTTKSSIGGSTDVRFQSIPKLSSNKDIKNAVESRRLSTDESTWFRLYEKLREDTANAPKVNFRGRYSFESMGFSTLGIDYVNDRNRVLSMSENNYDSASFWSNIPDDLKINAFIVDSCKAHPDVDLLKDLAKESCKLILREFQDKQLSGVWYLKKVSIYDKTDKKYSNVPEEESAKYGLYCNDKYCGFIRPCYYYNVIEWHSSLEITLAKIVSIMTSVPWLQESLWGNLILPCSGIAIKNFSGYPAVVCDSALGVLKKLSK